MVENDILYSCLNCRKLYTYRSRSDAAHGFQHCFFGQNESGVTSWSAPFSDITLESTAEAALAASIVFVTSVASAIYRSRAPLAERTYNNLVFLRGLYIDTG